jgi:hypothetical protein
MACPVCEAIERDLSDVARALARRKADKLSASQATDLDLEIRALVSAKAQIEAQFLKHQMSCVR